MVASPDLRQRFQGGVSTRGFGDAFRLLVDWELSLRYPYCLVVVPASGGSIGCSGRQALSSATPRPSSEWGRRPSGGVLSVTPGGFPIS